MNIEVIQKNMPHWECTTPSPHSGIYCSMRNFINRTGRKEVMVLVESSIMGNCTAHVFVHPETNDFMTKEEYQTYIKHHGEESLYEHEEIIAKVMFGVIVYDLGKVLFHEEELKDIKKDMMAIQPYIS